MRCDDCIALMVDAAEGRIDDAARGAIGTHLKGCPACAAAAGEFEAAAPVAAAMKADAAAPASPAAFDARVRDAVAREARERARGLSWWLPRLASTAVLLAVAAIAVTAGVRELSTDNTAASDEAVLSLFSTGSLYDPQTREEAAAVEEEMFSQVFSRKELGALDSALNGDLEEQIEEMDDMSLKAFEEQIDNALKKNSSG